jgi:hypothetical protein
MNERFDDLAKVLAQGASRRAVLRGIGAALAGAVLGSLGRPARAAPASPCCKAMCQGVHGRDRRSCLINCANCTGDGNYFCWHDGPDCDSSRDDLATSCSTICPA